MTDSDFGNRAPCLCSPKSVNSNKVAIARALEEELAGRRGSNQYKTKELPENFPDADSGKESAHIAAEKAGFSSDMTYRRGKGGGRT